MRSSWTKVAVAWALLASVTVGAVVLATGRPAAADPAITVSPADALVDGQVVQVHLSGFLPGAQVTVDECTMANHCRLHTATATADDTGAADLAVVVHAVIRPKTRGSAPTFGSQSCADGGGCVMVAFDQTNNPVTTPLTFVDDGPILQPAAVITPPNGLSDPQDVQVQVSAGSLDLGQDIALAQCIVRQSNTVPGPCGPPTGATASTTDAAVDAPFTVHASFTAVGTSDVVDCRTVPCAVLVTGGVNDVAFGSVSFAAVMPTVITAPPAASATPRFTG